MDEVKKYFSESTVSLILGVLVVLVLGAVAYKIFKGQGTTLPQNLVPVNEEQKTGEVVEPITAVSLPAQHTVIAGETLWSISERYYTSGYNWTDIARASNLKDADKIVVGQKLTIPNVEVKKAVVSTVKLTPVVTQSVIMGDKYTVMKGDSLWKISVRAYGDGYRWKEIALANKLANPRRIHAGNILTIPRP